MNKRRYIAPVANALFAEPDSVLLCGSPQALQRYEEETTDSWSNGRTASASIWGED